MSQFTAQIAAKIHNYGLPTGTFLNINAPDIPIEKIKGIKLTRQASNNLSKHFEQRIDPRNRSYYWYGSIDQTGSEKDTDVNALMENYISITPVRCDMTDYKTLAELETLTLP